MNNQSLPKELDNGLKEHYFLANLLVERLAYVPRGRFDATATFNVAELKSEISDLLSTAINLAKIETAQDIEEICPVTEGASVERLHNRIDSYLKALTEDK